MPNVTVTIDENGKTTIHVQGISGASCLAITEQIAKALGQVEDIQLTGEYSGGDGTEITSDNWVTS